MREEAQVVILKKVKEVVGKTRAATGQGSVESSARADRVEKEGDGLHEGKGRDSRRHKVGSMFVRLRMNRAVVGAVSKKSSMCQHSFFYFNLKYILSAY
jgi:hypothetical protein